MCDSYPPFTFSVVQESDGQAQWEQYMLPWHTMWNIDYHKMPGQKANVHPEIWNDSGTGEQILQNTFMALLRQPDGGGLFHLMPAATTSSNAGRSTEDPRSAYNGTTSVYRAMSSHHPAALWPVADHADEKQPHGDRRLRAAGENRRLARQHADPLWPAV